MCYGNWTKSGQNDPETFYDYCHGESITLFMFHTLQGFPVVKDFLVRRVPEGQGIDTDLMSSNGQEENLRKVKRRRRSTPSPSSVPSTLDVHVEDLANAMKESAREKIEARRGLTAAKEKEANYNAKQAAAVALREEIANTDTLRRIEKELLTELDELEKESNPSGHMSERKKNLFLDTKRRLESVRKRLDEFLAF